ncbi:MAG TPA: hypothetical protein PLJ25_06535, partial [Methanothrix sp.]|nr:hypothetical protein [Methanothrix sp.]
MQAKISGIFLMLAAVLAAMANGAVADYAAPFSYPNSLEKVSAEQVVVNANESPVTYDRALITGDLILSDVQNNPIRITNSVFQGDVI